MDEDANRALRAAEDARDLSRRHLVDEPQDQGPAAVTGEAADRPHRGPGLVTSDDALLDVEGIGHDRRLVDRIGRAPARRSALVPDDVSTQPELPHPERLV